MSASSREWHRAHLWDVRVSQALRSLLCGFLAVCLFCPHAHGDGKAQTPRQPSSNSRLDERDVFLRPTSDGGVGHRIIVGEGDVQLPVVVVRGTPYEMGRQLGDVIGDQMHALIPRAMAGIKEELRVSEEDLREVWSRTAAFTDDRIEQELAGLADGADMRLSLLQAMHAAPLLMPYSCSSVAAWGDATENGHLYQTRNLDWSLEVKAHEFPVIVVYVPRKGIPHIVPTFAGMIGAHTGMNIRGSSWPRWETHPPMKCPIKYTRHTSWPSFAPCFTTPTRSRVRWRSSRRSHSPSVTTLSSAMVRPSAGR